MTTPPVRRLLPGVRRRHIVLVAGMIIAALAGLDVLLLRDRLPAAHHLLYTSDGYLHGLNLETGEDRLLGGGGSLDPREAASPDGTLLAYWEDADDGWELIVQTPGEARTRESLGVFDLRFPTLAWSPDGTRLAFAISKAPGGPGMEELVILDVATSEVRPLTDNTIRDDSPAWSPDGRQLVFTSNADGYNRLHVIDVATGARRLLTDQAFGYVPAWSPDGSRIAFVSNHEDGHGDIYVVNVDGGGLRRLTFTDATDDNPTWMP